MGQDRKLLEKLLIKITEWANEEGNEWFRKELYKKYSFSYDNSVIEEKINSIEKYLLLDSQKSIDYTGIKDTNVQSQLVKDCIEMNRYRIGTVRHSIEFEQYCLFAHFQAEELLNYFFNIRHKQNIDAIIDEILNFNPGAKLKRDIKIVSSVDYKVKLVAYYKMEFLNVDLYSLLWDLSEIRNNLSHRSSLKLIDEDKILNDYKVNHFHINKVKFSDLPPDLLEVYKKGKILMILKDRDFQLIYNTIDNLKNSVLVNLNNRIFKKKVTLGDSPAFKKFFQDNNKKS